MKLTDTRTRSRFPAIIRAILTRPLNALALGSNVQHGGDFRAGFGALLQAPHSLRLGRHVSIGPGSVIECDGTVGDFVMVGRNVQIVGRDDHAIDELGVPMLYSTWVGERAARSRDIVTIGDDVWIGANAVVLSGVTVGNGAVIAAGAVVARDVAPFTIVAGNPACPISARFTTDEERLHHLANIRTFGNRMATKPPPWP